MASGKFLPKHSECAGLKCTISHKSQPTNNRSLKCTNCCGLMTILASNANTKPAAKYAKKKQTKKTKQAIPQAIQMRKLRLCQKEHHCFQWKG